MIAPYGFNRGTLGYVQLFGRVSEIRCSKYTFYSTSYATLIWEPQDLSHFMCKSLHTMFQQNSFASGNHFAKPATRKPLLKKLPAYLVLRWPAPESNWMEQNTTLWC